MPAYGMEFHILGWFMSAEVTADRKLIHQEATGWESLRRQVTQDTDNPDNHPSTLYHPGYEHT